MIYNFAAGMLMKQRWSNLLSLFFIYFFKQSHFLVSNQSLRKNEVTCGFALQLCLSRKNDGKSFPTKVHVSLKHFVSNFIG